MRVRSVKASTIFVRRLELFAVSLAKQGGVAYITPGNPALGPIRLPDATRLTGLSHSRKRLCTCTRQRR